MNGTGSSTAATQNQQLIELPPEQIQQLLNLPGMAPGQLSTIASLLELTPGELQRLQSGQSGLSMTPQQYEALKAAAARAYAKGSATTADTTTSSGGDWGCSGSPSPTPTTTPTTAPTPAPMTSVPPVTKTETNLTESAAGTTAALPAGGKVGVGTVTLRTGVEGKMGGTELKGLFAISYKGADSKDAHWLQFINREIIGVKDDGSTFALTDSITTTGGTYKLTPGGTDKTTGTPTADNYNTDSADASDPFYEAAGVNNRSADATTIYDLPGNATALVKTAFDAGAKKVYSRAHFNTYLVQKDTVTYHVSIDIEWVFNSAADDPARVQKAGPAGSASTLPAEIAKKFHAQYPKFAFIK